MHIKVSAVIPTYNRAPTLPRAIRSVLSQSVPCSEVIVVDDGSTDGTSSMLSADFPDIRYHRLNGKCNAAVARNIGVDLATGNYIAFLDSDDEWDSTHVESALARLCELDKNTLLAMSFKVIDGSNVTKFRQLGDHQVTSIADQLLRGALDLRSSALVASRDLVARVRFDDSLTKHQDWDFAARCEAKGKVVTSANCTVSIHETGSSRMSGRPDHPASDAFLRRHRENLSKVAKANFACQRAESTLRAEGRSRRFHRYAGEALPLLLSGDIQSAAKLTALIVPGGLQVISAARRRAKNC